jgi:SpoIID/LytB domain protein
MRDDSCRTAIEPIMNPMGASYHRTIAAFATFVLTAWTSAAQAATLVVDGAGDGHGVGMSQEGALGYAQHGWSYEQILAHYYAGTSLGSAPARAVVRVLLHGKVKRVPLERYVRGVVAAEVSSDWPMAALEAQAVASRTYALTAHAGGSKFDVYPDTRSQMYLGKAAETPRTNAAVQTTAGEIVTYGGQPAITYFFASSGGHTESVQNAFPGSAPRPWLVGVEDPYDAGPLHRWTITLSFHEAGVRMKGLVSGRLEGIEVLRRGTSPRIVSAYVLGSKGRTLVTGAQLTQRLGLHDTWAYFSVSDVHGTHPEPDLSGGRSGANASGEGASEGGTVPAGLTSTEVTAEGGSIGPAAPAPQTTDTGGTIAQ